MPNDKAESVRWEETRIMNLRTSLSIAGLLFGIVLVNGEAYGDNESTPLHCKSVLHKIGTEMSGYPGPTITNNTQKTFKKGRRVRWQKTSNGPGNSLGEIVLKSDFAPGAKVNGMDDIGSASCTATVDKFRPDLYVKGGSVDASSVTVKIANADEWPANNAYATIKIMACGTTTGVQTVKSSSVDLAKGEVKSVTVPYTALPGGKVIAEVSVALTNKSVDEISTFNNTKSFTNCPCGGAKQCGGANGTCPSGQHCSNSCCAPIPPG